MEESGKKTCNQITIQVYRKKKLLARDYFIVSSGQAAVINLGTVLPSYSLSLHPNATEFLHLKIPKTAPNSNTSDKEADVNIGAGISVYMDCDNKIYINKNTHLNVLSGNSISKDWGRLERVGEKLEVYDFKMLDKESYNDVTQCPNNVVRVAVGCLPHPTSIYDTDFHIKLTLAHILEDL